MVVLSVYLAPEQKDKYRGETRSIVSGRDADSEGISRNAGCDLFGAYLCRLNIVTKIVKDRG
jgi:hypothetical protein